jgi:hypothetical protein
MWWFLGKLEIAAVDQQTTANASVRVISQKHVMSLTSEPTSERLAV